MTDSQIILKDKLNQELVNIIGIEDMLKQIKSDLSSRKSRAMEMMKSLDLTEVELDIMTKGKFKVSLSPESECFRVDTDRLKDIYNNIYQDCVKVSTTKEHLTIRAKK